ncbi:MAG: hypothetical protein IK027_00380 [Deltaproteobacteria bacterium]|nr:hypothetical protein [Deltaproteobacteria bacterium]
MASTIDLSSVNLSIQQFQQISSGKYNAGEIKLTSETGLGKINDHVTMKWLNKKDISHEEVLAIKQAFIKALSDNGVDSAELDRIRRSLGLAPDGAVDRGLRERSIRPLTRQQVREILDHNANAINQHNAGRPGAERIRTSAEIYGVGGMKASRAADRDAVNNALDQNRTTSENVQISRFQSVVAGDVDFHLDSERKELLSEARKQLDTLLKGCGGQPSPNKPAEVKVPLPNGQTIVMDIGMSETEFAKKLEDEIVRHKYGDKPVKRDLEIRNAFQSLSLSERLAWLDNVKSQPKAAWEARTIAVMLMHERGVTDFETLSLVNKASLDAVLGIVRQMIESSPEKRGEALQKLVSDHLRMLSDPQFKVDKHDMAFIPALSPGQFNKAVRELFTGKNDTGVPREFKAIVDETLVTLRERFGEAVVPKNAALKPFIDERELDKLARVEGKGDGSPVQRVSVEAMREGVMEMALEEASQKAVRNEIQAAGARLGLSGLIPHIIANGIFTSMPELKAKLVACKSLAEVDDTIGAIRTEVEKAVVRDVSLRRCKQSFGAFVREAICDATGIPVSCLAEKSLPNSRLDYSAALLAQKIAAKQIPAATDADIETLFRGEAAKFAAERANILARADVLKLSDDARADLKGWLLSQDKVSYLDLDAIMADAKKLDMKAVADALKAGAPKEIVYDAMTKVMIQMVPLVHAQLQGKMDESGTMEHTNVETIMLIAAFDAFPGILDGIAAFLERPDVKADDVIHNAKHPAFSFVNFAAPKAGEANAQLAAGLASGTLSPIHGQALAQAARDAGLGDFSPDKAFALFRPDQPAGKILAEAIGASPVTVSPPLLRSIALDALKSLAASLASPPNAPA